MMLREQTRKPQERFLRAQMILGLVLFMAGLALSGFAFATIAARDMHTAQLMSQRGEQPPADQVPRDQTSGSSAPAESKPGGTRPTTPAPEPARPESDAQKVGAPAALPPAPAEKSAPPIDSK